MYFPPNNSSFLKVRTIKLAPISSLSRGKVMILSESNFHAWKLPWASVLTWVVFLLTRLINAHHALCTLKVVFLLRKGHFSKNSCWQKPPTHTQPLEPLGSVHCCVKPLPFLTKAIGLITETPAAYPQRCYVCLQCTLWRSLICHADAPLFKCYL